jgi:tryptophan synthase alpha chain
MHRIDRCFVDLERAGKKALCVYLCVGDPSLDESVSLALAAIDAGADLLELGVPFSDPTADGPVLAQAARRAIAAGATLERVVEVARHVRRRSDAPLVLFTYYNPVFVVGEARVANLASDAGVDAMLVVDLPPEEAGSLRNACASCGMGLVPLVTPTSDAERVDVIRRLSVAPPGAPKGFLYAVSMTGVTGSAAADVAAMGRSAVTFRRAFDMPVLVGFGIDCGESARAAAGRWGAGPDGVVVGTAIMRRIEQGGSPDARVRLVRSFVRELRQALDAD